MPTTKVSALERLTELMTDPPKIHEGGELTWSLHEEVLEFIVENVGENAKTLETGAGMSTVLFTLISENHTCIVPSQQQVDFLKAYCEVKEVCLDHVQFLVERSEDVLPTLDLTDLDLVLIDGGHGFPVPAIDWFYTAPMLKQNGIVIVDDTQIWTGLILKQFLTEEPEWKLLRDFSMRSAAFAKVGDDYSKEWGQQPFVLRKSRFPIFLQRARGGMLLLFRGEFRKLLAKINRQITVVRKYDP